MGTINDFKIVSQYSYKYFDFLDLDIEINDIQKKRFGFYFFILECITNNTDINELKDTIIDTQFCRMIYNENNNDYGIDAVYINEETNTIQLFNFKYRESFGCQKSQNERSILDSSKFLIKLHSREFDMLDRKTRKQMERISEKFDSDEIWKMELYLVSNDNYGLKADNETLNNYKDYYDINVQSIALDDIISFISDRPDDISATFVTDVESVLTYEENSLSSSKSYLVKLSVADLIRITSKSKDQRENIGIQNSDSLKSSELELGILYDNVRGYLGDTKFNKNIFNTLDNEPSKFFMYNNGITITAKNIVAKEINGKTKFLCTINGYQIVNGGQTIRTIYEFKNKKFDDEKLANAEVLVRIFQTEEDQELTNNIAEFTNSQNAISSTDLKSISNFQIQIEKYLEGNNIQYVRKSGDIGKSDKKYNYRISMERLGQIIYSYLGYPDRATNQKAQLFERYYDEIFNENELDFSLLLSLIDKYYKIEALYEKLGYEPYPQKYFYIIFLLETCNYKRIDEAIKSVEKALKEYRKEENLSDPRKLIQKGFKTYLETNYTK